MRNGRKLIFILCLATLFVLPGVLTTPEGTPMMPITNDTAYDIDEGTNEQNSIFDQIFSISNIPSSTSGSGTLIGVKEYANGTFPGRSAGANDSSTFYPQTFDIPAGWYTTSITAMSSQMYHLTDWIENGQFTSSADPWVYDDSGDTVGVISGAYELGEYISLTRVSGGKVKYDWKGEWIQTVSVTEGGTASATLNVTYKIDTSSGTNGQNAMPYLNVNGTTWELPTGGERFSVNQDWTVFSVDLPLDDFSFPGDLDIALGVQGFADTQFQTTGILSLDNVSLTLRTSRLAEVVELSARDTYQTSNEEPFVTGTGGKGYAIFSGNWSDTVTLEFMSNETGTEFNLELFMELQRNSYLDTNTYTVSNGTVAIWQSEFTAREMAYPFTYYYFNASLPNDWTISTVYDAYNDLQLSDTTYYNATYYPSDGILLCDVFGTGVSGTPHYGTWTINSTAPNYGNAISFMGDFGGVWTEVTNYYPQSPLRVDLSFLDGSSNPPTTGGTSIIELYDTEGTLIYSESGNSLDLLGDTTYQNGTGSANITILPTWLAGPVTGLATWTNGTAVGEIRKQFYIFHHTELEIEAATYSAFRGDTISVRVKYIDSETGLGIAGGTLYYEWLYGSDNMGYAGNGWYAGYVDTSVAVIGGYSVTVNATKDYYDFGETSAITIDIQEKTTLYSPKNLQTPTTDYEIAWGNSKTIYLAYEDTIAMNPDTMSAGPGTPTSPDVSDAYTSNNVYTSISSVGDAISLTVQTDVDPYDFLVSDLTTLTIKLEGKFSTAVNSGTVYAYNVTSSSWVMVIDSYSPTIDTTLTWKTTTPSHFINGSGFVQARIDATHSSAFTYDLDLFDFIAGRPIDDTVPDVSLTSNWPAQTVVGTQNGPIYNSSLKIWQVTFNTAGVTPGEYSVLVQASATGHQEKVLELTITVRPHHSRVSAVPPSETPWGWMTWINISISDTDNSSILISEGNLTFVEIVTPYGTQVFTNSNWTYSQSTGAASVAFWVDTNEWVTGSYSLAVNVYTDGSGLSKHFDDGTTGLQITVRPHDISITANPPTQTPWGWDTNVTVILSDLDNSSISINPTNVTSITVAGQVFTSSDWTYADGVFSFYVDTSSWLVSSQAYTVIVTGETVPNRYYNDRQGNVLITIREHGLSVSSATTSSTPWSWMTNVSVTLVDADNSSLPVSEANVTSIVIAGQSFTSSDWTYLSGVFYVMVDTSSWQIGTTSRQVTVNTATVPSRTYYDGISSVTIQIRNHLLGVSVVPPASTPWSWMTTISITIQDLDNSSILINEANITQITIGAQIFTSVDWSYAAGVFTITLDTSSWSIGSAAYGVAVTTATAPSKAYADGSSSVTVTIRAHNIGISISPPASTPWGWVTDVSFTLIDLDNGSITINEANITQVVIAGQVFTSAEWSYAAGTFTCTVNTSNWAIGSASYGVSLTTSSAGYKYFNDATNSVSIQITSHGLAVQPIRPPATPYSDKTTVTINISDLSNGTLIVTEANITQIDIDGQIFTSASWIYSSGQITVVLDTDAWAVGSFSLTVTVSTSGSGVTKFYLDSIGSLTVDIRERYTEAYSPTPDPVPSGDNLTFYIEFRDRDASRDLVNATTLYLNGTDLTEEVDFWVVWLSEGYYQVTMVTSGLSLGDNLVYVEMVRTNYENASTTVRFRIRVTDTEALASGYRFNVPIGSNAVFTVQFNDVDHNVGILADTIVSNTTLAWSASPLGGGLYQVTVVTTDATALGSYPIRFNFTKSGYEDAYVIIVISVETHNSYLSFDEGVVPTDIASNISVYLFYEDISLGTGISNSTSEIAVSVWFSHGGGDGWANIFVQDNLLLGTGHYLIEIPANQFGGLYTVKFTAFFNWTGVAKYESLNRTFTVDLQGTDTDLSISIAPQAIYYGDLVNFTLYYEATQSSTGVQNSTGDVYGFAFVIGQPIGSSDFQISWIGQGLYRFVLDSSLFISDGSFVIKTFLNWTPTASPFYENQTLSITVTILVRTTLLDVVPPQNTAYDEVAIFTFTYYDSPSNTVILNSTSLFVQLNNPGISYSLGYSSGTWTVTVDTASIGSTGAVALELNVTWVGAPFYQNQTKFVSLTVTTRPTQLSYTPPTPTFFASNVSITFTFIDLIDDSSVAMNGGTLVLSSGALTLTGNYTIADNGDGTYDLVMNTTAFLEPGTYSITAEMTYGGSRFCNDAQVSFTLRVLYRAILATAEPVGNTAFQNDISITLHLSDGETANDVLNSTGAVRINIGSQNASSPDILGLIVTWTPGSDTYLVEIANTLSIGTHVLYLNVSYDYASPYYGYRIVQLTISIRKHSTEIQLYEPAVNTGFGLNSTFQLYYVDLDTGLPITGTTINVANASLTGAWSIVEVGGNLYEVRINTSAFLAIGTYWVELTTQNTGPYSNYQDTSIFVRVYVRERYTILSYDAVGTVGYTDDVVITVYFSDSDLGNSPITNSTGMLTLTTNQSIYTVTNGAVAGSYEITMPANQFVAFDYSTVLVSISYSGAPYYQGQSISVRFQISGTSTEFAWDPSDPIPYGDYANVTFYWGDIDSGIPVSCTLGVDTAITVVSLTQPGLDTTNVTILNIVQGSDVGAYATFFFLLNTSYLDTYGTYEFRITINWTDPGLAPYYEDQNNKLLNIVVRMRNTAVPQILVDSVSYGENATVRLQYVDIDSASQLITGPNLNIAVLDDLTYEVNPTPQGGFYEVYVVTEGTGLLGTVRINMTIEWYGTPYYKNQTSIVAILTINMKVATMEVTYPDVTPYLDNVTFVIQLRDSISLEYINDLAANISGILVTPSIGSTPLIEYIPTGIGLYNITFNTTILGQLGNYVLTITFDHSGASPYYNVLSRNVTGLVRARATSLDYEPISSQPYGNYSVFSVTYSDVDASPTAYISSGDVYVACTTSTDTLEEGVNYWISYLGSGEYQINISTIALGAPNTYVLSVVVNSTADWWLAESSRNINFRVSHRTVELSVSSPDSTYYDEVTYFIVTLIDIDAGGVGSALVGMAANIELTFTTPSGLSTGSVNIVDIGNGQYNISFDTTILNQLTDYTIQVFFNAPNYWADAGPRSVTGRVSARPTQLSYDVSGTTPYLDNVTIIITFEDSLSTSGVVGGTITLSCSTAAIPLSLGSNYWITDVGGGQYTADIDSIALGDVDTFSISAQMAYSGEPFYQNRSTSIPVEVRERATRLTYIPPSETPFSDDIVVNLNYYDVDAGLVAITGSVSYFSLDEINGSSVDSSYYWVEYVSGATYKMHINSTKLDIYGRYVLTISVTGNPTFRYDNQLIFVNADVRARSTQLSTAPISQASYTENATVTFYYTDIDADSGIFNESVSGGVQVGLNTSVSWWILQDSPGTYRLLINSSELGSTGNFAFLASFSWVNGKPYYANHTLEFVVSITGAGSVLTYSPPDHVPIGDDIVITLEYRDSNTGDGITNSSGFVHISITPSNSTPAGPFQYVISNPSPGVYVYTINSTPFWTSGSIYFKFDVSWTDGELPYYPDVNGTTIRAVIREIFTQTLADSPIPGTVPIGDSATVIITFYDLDHSVNVFGASITTTWAYGWSYEVLGDGRFNITLQTTGISSTGQASAMFTFNKTFYLTKTSTVYLTIRLVSTSGYATAPDPSIVPIGDTVTFEITHFDTDHLINITDGNIATSWAYGWSWVRTPSGGFSITLQTAGVPNLIKYTVAFTLSKIDHADAIVSVRFEVRAIQTSITSSFTSNIAAGNNISIVVTYEDLDHSSGITGANILTDAASYGVTYSWEELSAGQYNITYFLWNHPAGSYSFDITALLTQHDPASMVVDIVLELASTELYADESLMLLNWSESIDLMIHYEDRDFGGLIQGADVRATLSGSVFVLTYTGAGYEVSIDSSIVKAGTYLITVTANKTNFEARIMQITVVISVLETTFVSLGDIYSVSVVSGESFNITVYYESLALGGVVGATVSYQWDYGTGSMLTTGQAGYYSAIIDTTDTPVNVYTLYVRANKSNHVEASIYFSLDVGLVETELTPVGEATLRAVFGEVTTLLVNYTNVNLELPVISGTLLFRFSDANYTGFLTESAPGIYNATIETSHLYAGTFSMYIVATKPGYETRTLSMLLEVQRISTSVSTDVGTVVLTYGEITEVLFNFSDTHYNVPIDGAQLEYRWQGSTGNLTSIGNGLYRATINSSEVIPGFYRFYVTATKSNYVTDTTDIQVEVNLIEMEMLVNSVYDVPVGDPLTIEIQINDISYNRSVVDAEGSVIWSGLSLELTPVLGVPGNYTFTIPQDTGLNSYDVTIVVNKLYHRSISKVITVIVRPIATQLATPDGQSFVTGEVGQYLVIELYFTDLDHNEPITGATISVSDPANVLPEGGIDIDESDTVDGLYTVGFWVPIEGDFEIIIHVSLGQEYESLDIPITVVSSAPSNPLGNLIFYGGSFGVIIALIGALLWVKIFSVPKLVRIMNGMIKSLSKGKVPENPECSGRDQLLHDMINEELEPVNIYKPLDEIPRFTVEFHIPEIESLLAELAEITGLEETDVAAFRTDLARMKPSERPGFLNEVIKQERARRAEEIAEKKPEKDDATRLVTPEELEEVGERLLQMGLSQEQVDEVLEGAKDMTRAELETVLDQLDDSLNQ